MVQKIIDRAFKAGLDYAVSIPVDKIRFDPGLYVYCKQNYCGKHKRNWACPHDPDVAQTWTETIKSYQSAVLVETLTDNDENAFNWESFQMLHAEHQRQFHELVREVRTFNPNVQPLSAEHCCYCETCTCPDAPCPYPDQCFPAIEGVGVFVKELCDLGNIPYGNAIDTVTFISLLLVQE